ncbi:MAG TPA: P1 family peptidase [Nitriliruptoraceae bacterium]|nr:P1 family peptidase [Nitriliruptoraceae bacterium]
MALGLDDVSIGVWQSPVGQSGCTVVLPPDGTVGSIAVRGQAPGTREAAALDPASSVQHVHAIVLSGGSAFGLSTADGVMRWLESKGRGHPVPGGAIPIVGAAIILDEAATDPDARPDADAGWAACLAAGPDDVEGAVGAGAGARVAKVGGLDHLRPGGQGIAVVEHGDVVVAALVVNNAVGEVIDQDGTVLVGTTLSDDQERWPYDPEVITRGMEEWMAAMGMAAEPSAGTADPTAGRGNTVVGCVVTNATLTKAHVHRMADLAHDGIALAVRPAHTSMDGDALFGLATGRVAASMDLVATMAVEAVATAARRGPVVASHEFGA